MTNNQFEYTTSAESDKKVVAIIVRGSVAVSSDLIESLPNLKVIISASIGFDTIDINSATKQGIYVANCPYGSAVSTAEHTLALLLSGIKSIGKANNELKNNSWDRKTNVTHEFYGKSVGVIGLGKIGSYVAKMYETIGMKVYGFDPYIPDYEFHKVDANKIESLEELISKVNYLSVHVAKSEDTESLVIKEHILKLQKPNGIVNTARGGIVSESDLIECLKNGDLNFYCADVFENEPNPSPELLSLPNVIATPHIAANTIEAQNNIAKDVISQLKEVVVEERFPKYLVNRELIAIR